MTSFLIALGLVLLFAAILIVPVIRPRKDAFRFYVSGRSGVGDLLLRRRTLLENLRDLEIERELGKLSPADFEDLALPIARELSGVEQALEASRGKTTAPASVRRHRLGFTCPVCGCLNRGQTITTCGQCGTDFS